MRIAGRKEAKKNVSYSMLNMVIVGLLVVVVVFDVVVDVKDSVNHTRVLLSRIGSMFGG